ncbi:cell surface protein [Bacillus pseudomycoides]|uniref:cell surface protein n=1 Tax=Bacillus pseudomycoides TaxID=64104 RepID=UPI001F0ABC87|nr:cell surface protein [Bacillus pseudomycoides]
MERNKSFSCNFLNDSEMSGDSFLILQDQIIESDKTVKNLQNTITEIGDELAYTIRTRNTLLASLVKNLAIADTFPEGL